MFRIPDGEQQYILIFFRHRLERLQFDEKWVLQLIDSHRANGQGFETSKIVSWLKAGEDGILRGKRGNEDG
jgi:hypothetical protein